MMFIAHTLITLRDKLAAEDKERGATAIEYGVIVALISVVIIVALVLIGDPVVERIEGAIAELGL